MVDSAMILLADFSSREVLVADMAKNFSNGCLTLLILLLFAHLGVPVLADVALYLLLVALLVLLWLVTSLARPAGDPSLTLPIGPHM